VRAIIALSSAVAMAVLAPSPCAARELADPQKQACADAYDNSQLLRDRRQLTLARAQLVVCQRACPRRLAADCDAWLADIEQRMPTVELVAVDSVGQPVEGHVSVDGQPDQPLPVQSVRLEPGKHAFRFERASDGAVVERNELVGEGDEARRVTATFAPLDTGGLTSSDAAAISLVVIGGVALVVAGALGIKGQVDRSALYDCRPRCAQEDVDAIATTWTAAGILAAAGGAALGGALLVWLLSDAEVPSAEAGSATLGPTELVVRF